MSYLSLESSKALAKAIKEAGIEVPDTEKYWNAYGMLVDRDSKRANKKLEIAPAPNKYELKKLAVNTWENGSILTANRNLGCTISRFGLGDPASDVERLAEAIIAVLVERSK